MSNFGANTGKTLTQHFYRTHIKLLINLSRSFSVSLTGDKTSPLSKTVEKEEVLTGNIWHFGEFHANFYDNPKGSPLFVSATNTLSNRVESTDFRVLYFRSALFSVQIDLLTGWL